MSEFATQLSNDMLKQAGISSFLLTRGVPGLMGLLRGTANMAKDFNVGKRMPNLYKRLESMGQGAERMQGSADQWVKGLSRPKRWAANAAGFVVPGVAMTLPVVGPAMMPLGTAMQNVGNAAGQAQVAGSAAGKQLAVAGGANRASQFYDWMSNLPYSQRRQVMNQPQDWSAMSQGTRELAGVTPAKPMGAAGAIWNTVNPWGSGDISPYIRQQAIKAMPR